MNLKTNASLTRLGLSFAGISAALLAGMGSTGASASPVQHPLAPAAVVAGSTAVVDGSGLRVTGTGVANQLVLSLPGTRFQVTDSKPITAGAGCNVVDIAGPRFGVSCTVVRTGSGQIRSVTVNTGAGNDTFRNDSPAPVRVDGGIGDDVLRGGSAGDLLNDDSGRNIMFGRGGSDTLSSDFGTDTQPDELRGGAGDDDLRAGISDDLLLGGDGDDSFRGGLGADDVDGGAGDEDAMVYLDNDHDGVRVIASLDGVANDGATDEGDNIVDGVEQLFGGNANDILTGGNDDDELSGNLGDDVLIGLRGADRIDGGPGNDNLASNQLFGVPVQDGSIDVLNGNVGDFDRCRVPFTVVEDDATISCEIVNED